MVEEWERKEKELTRKGWKDIEYGGMICQKSQGVETVYKGPVHL